MQYCENNKQYRNRAERRKNGIRSEKKPNYSREQIERIIKKELQDLISQPYSETVKRERYRRLEPLIEEYKKSQKTKGEIKPVKTVSVAGKEEYTIVAYKKERQNLTTNPVYQKMQNQVAPVSKTVAKTNPKVQKAITAYQKQTQYTKVQKPVVQKSQVKTKKGFFARLLEVFKLTAPKKQTVLKKTQVVKPKVSEIPVRYYNPKPVKEIGQEIYNEFEKRLRDMNRYSKENPSYKVYRNGRQVNFEPRYL